MLFHPGTCFHPLQFTLMCCCSLFSVLTSSLLFLLVRSSCISILVRSVSIFYEPASFSAPLSFSLQTRLQRLNCMLVITSAESSEAYGTAFCYVESDPAFVSNYCPPSNKNTVTFQTCLKLRY